MKYISMVKLLQLVLILGHQKKSKKQQQQHNQLMIYHFEVIKLFAENGIELEFIKLTNYNK